MRIKGTSGGVFLTSRIGRLASGRNIALLAYSIAVFCLGVAVQKTGVFGLVVKPALFDTVNFSKNFCKGLTARPDRLEINIKYMDYQKLAYRREIALADKVLFASPDDFVPAMIKQGDKIVNAKIRLKGDWVTEDNLGGDKWSFRIKVTRDDTIFGMKEFSVHPPEARNYISEWIYHAALKKEGILSLRYKFIRLTLNGKDKGVYAVEENFDKLLIENNQFREGPILRFNEEPVWRQIFNIVKFNTDSGRIWESGSYLSSDIDTFQRNKVFSSTELFSQYEKAFGLLESFRRGILKTSDVFDVPKLAAYFALNDLFGAEHGSRWHNARFYYNPITSRLEPVGFDATLSEKPMETLCATEEAVHTVSDSFYDNRYYNAVFSDRAFFKEYVKELERVSDTAYLDRLFYGIKSELEKNLNIIYNDFPAYHFSKDVFYRNQEFIQSCLNPPAGIHAYYKGHSIDKVEFSLGNVQLIPVEVLGISLKGKVLTRPENPVLLPAKDPLFPVEYVEASFPLPGGVDFSDSLVKELKVDYRLLGTSGMVSEGIFPWPYLSEETIRQDVMKREPNAESFGFLDIDKDDKSIAIKPGTWTIEKSVIIPAGYKLVCDGGTNLKLEDSAGLISFSPVEFIGEEESPIFISSRDPENQGIVVINAGSRSVMENVIFENLSNIKETGSGITGAVTFYQSPVRISHCRFLNNKSEDSLNIIRSDFLIDKTLFEKTSFDAFDADFCRGEIRDSSFVNCGNDGIDVSGSIVKIENVLVNKTGDKGVSVGEDSKMTADKIEVKNANLAVVSKDRSELKIRDIKISDCKIGFSAYQKKSEFGPAYIEASAVSMQNVAAPYLIEKGSLLTIDGRTIKADQENLKSILYKIPGEKDASIIKSPFNGLSLDTSGKGRKLSFLLIGHAYGSPWKKSTRPASSLLANIRLLNGREADFMVFLGDIVRQPARPEIEELKNSFLSKMDFPVFNAPGNHDVSDRQLYEDFFGKTFFSFEYSSSFFIFLDSELNDGKIQGEQLKFLTDDIEYCKTAKGIKNIFIFIHRLVWAVKNPPYDDILPYVNNPDCYPEDTGTFSTAILPELRSLTDKNIYLISGDIGCEWSQSLFYEKEMKSNITYLATGIGDTNRDAVIKVDVDEFGKAGFTPVSLTKQRMPPIECFNIAYWKNNCGPGRRL